jgi:hypothetical protein
MGWHICEVMNIPILLKLVQSKWLMTLSLEASSVVLGETFGRHFKFYLKLVKHFLVQVFP